MMWNIINLKLIIFWTILFILLLGAVAESDSIVIPNKKQHKNSDYKEYIDDDFARFPKCCPTKSALLQTNGNETIECSSISIMYKHFEISSANISTLINDGNFADNCEYLDCIDFLQNGTEWQLVRLQNCLIKTIYRHYIIFPKCCPLDFAYDPKKHNCVQQNDSIFSFGGYLQVVNVSLAHCPAESYAIEDFEEAFTVDSDERSVELQNGKTFNYSQYCIDQNPENGQSIIRACLKYEEVCSKNGKRCLKKCCPDGEIYISKNNKPTCTVHYTEGFDVENNARVNNTSDYNYAVIQGGAGSRYIEKVNHKFFIDNKGLFHVLENDKWQVNEPKNAYYCIESWLTGKSARQYNFLYSNINKSVNIQSIKFNIQGIVLGLSCLCLLITILCYIFLPETQNVHGKSILMFCIFLFVGFCTLCFIQLHGSTGLAHEICVSIGFTIVFTFLGSFAWMNVICFDMWMAFGTMRVLDVKNKRKDMKKFMYYSLYAWGVPIIICGLALIVYNTECLPNEFVPHMGYTKCYFDKNEKGYDYLLYFIVPETIMILINCAFFLKTSIYCYKVKNEIQRMRSISNGNETEKKRNNYQDEKEKLVMLLKLFLLMGIPWTFEVFSSIISFKDTLTLQIIETICDCINSGEGIIIFCIFILKKKVILSMKKLLGMEPKRRISEISTTAVTNITGTNGNANKKEPDLGHHI